jgi:hypothetical protein
MNSLPAALTSIRHDEAFVKGTFMRGEILPQQGSTTGIRYRYGPIVVEYYTGDTEPSISPCAGLRSIIWDRITPTHPALKWLSLPTSSLAPNAIVSLEGEYWKNWAHGTKAHRNKWTHQTEFEIVRGTVQEFISLFKKYSRPRHTVRACADSILKQKVLHGDKMNFLFLKHIATGEISAGICTIDYPSVNQSYYAYSFYAREYIPRQAGVWLLDAWFQKCLKRGTVYANLGTVYAPGQPKSWKGFSQFKMYFDPLIFTYQPPLCKFTFSLKGGKARE